MFCNVFDNNPCTKSMSTYVQIAITYLYIFNTKSLVYANRYFSKYTKYLLLLMGNHNSKLFPMLMMHQSLTKFVTTLKRYTTNDIKLL